MRMFFSNLKIICMLFLHFQLCFRRIFPKGTSYFHLLSRKVSAVDWKAKLWKGGWGIHDFILQYAKFLLFQNLCWFGIEQNRSPQRLHTAEISFLRFLYCSKEGSTHAQNIFWLLDGFWKTNSKHVLKSYFLDHPRIHPDKKSLLKIVDEPSRV